MSAEAGLTEAEQEALRDCWELGFRPIQITVARIKADAIAQERAAWVVKIEALHRPLAVYEMPDESAESLLDRIADGSAVLSFRVCAECAPEWVVDEIEDGCLDLSDGEAVAASWPCATIALLSSDATAACACVCHSGGVGTGCRQSRCEVCPPATAALNTVREQAKAEERVHDHPPYRPACNERLVEGQLRGACLNDDGSEAGR